MRLRARAPGSFLSSKEKDPRNGRGSQKCCEVFSFTLPVSCGQTGGCRRVDARFALAVWTLTFGPFAVETSVPSDACHPWHWSLSALVTVGAGRCEKPLDQPSNPTLDKRAGSFRSLTKALAASGGISNCLRNMRGIWAAVARHVSLSSQGVYCRARRRFLLEM